MKIMDEAKIFYSWQSDQPNFTNRGFIQEALEKSVKAIRSDESLEVDPVVDRDTQNEPGSPDIVHSIFQKIENAAVFIADVTIISDETANRATPNPNVLVELGYALKTLGSGRVLMVMNTAYGDIKKLPFDLDHRRVITYEFHEKDKGKTIPDERGKEENVKAQQRRELMGKLESNLRTILAHHTASEPESVKTSFELLEEALSESTNVFKVKKIVLGEAKRVCEQINSLTVLSQPNRS